MELMHLHVLNPQIRSDVGRHRGDGGDKDVLQYPHHAAVGGSEEWKG